MNFVEPAEGFKGVSRRIAANLSVKVVSLSEKAKGTELAEGIPKNKKEMEV